MNIFDIIGPIMAGPSSSHTAGAVRMGLSARKPRMVGRAMPSSLRETGEGGLAATPTGRRIAERR